MDVFTALITGLWITSGLGRSPIVGATIGTTGIIFFCGNTGLTVAIGLIGELIGVLFTSVNEL